MKTIIAGGRDFNDYHCLVTKCDNILSLKPATEIISGGASGADSLGERYARERNIKITRFIPNWDKHGKKAGFLRNTEMANYADALIAFWNGKSKGTFHMISEMKRLNKPYRIILYNQ
jgi:hypothetical protein